MKKFLTGVLLIFSLTAFSSDSIRYYKFIRSDLNYFQFHDSSAIRNLVNVWKNDRNFVVAHIGDSHVQPDIITSELRKSVQLIKGNGGRGMVFPYAAARTHSAYDYFTRYTGQWQYARNTDPSPRLPLGITGVTIRSTTPGSTFNISFKDGLPANNRKMRIYCRRSESSFDLSIQSGQDIIPVKIFNGTDETGPVEILLPSAEGKFNFSLIQNESGQTEFELYGISIEADDNEGAVVHSLGVSGAPYTGILREALLEDHLKSMNPDLVIIDLGTNDYIPGNRIASDLEIKIRDIIRKIRRATPSTTVLLTTTQDMYRKGVNMSAGRSLSLLIREIAKKESCLYFDWYWISGGPATMKQWVSYGLAQRDHIHLTGAGYKLKGRLLAGALENTLTRLREEPTLKSLILHEDSAPLPYQTKRDSLRKIPEPTSGYYRPASGAAPSGKLVSHTIRLGETLGGIAEKYGVSVASIRELNGIYGSKIIAGKSIKIIVKNSVISKATAGQSPSVSANPAKQKNTIRHLITSGETLISIAEKYKVSVEEIKRVNGLLNSRIVAGKTLVIPVTDPSETGSKS